MLVSAVIMVFAVALGCGSKKRVWMTPG